MKLPPLAGGFLRALVSLLKYLTWRRHLKKLPKFLILLSNLFLRTSDPEDPPCNTVQPSSPDYTVSGDRNPLPLDHVAASIYPFAGGNTGKISRNSLRSYSGSPERSPSESPNPRQQSWSNDVSRNSLTPEEDVQVEDTTGEVLERNDRDLMPISVRTDLDEAISVQPEVASEQQVDPDSHELEDSATDSVLFMAAPTLPGECSRKMQHTSINLEPLDFNFETFPTPAGWERYAHPEGCCYFYNPSKRVYTDNEIYNPEQLARIEELIQTFEACKPDGFPVDAELVLNIYPQDIQYYCVDHDRRVIFFLTAFKSEWMPSWVQVAGAFSKNHLRKQFASYEIESEYWFFVQLYPHRLHIPLDLIDELADIVLFFMGDIASSSYSNAPFTEGTLKTILEVTSKAKETIGSTHTAGTVAALARFMFIFCHARFLDFHGESYGRIEGGCSVYGDLLYPQTVLHRIISLLLFSAPDVYLKTLRFINVDNNINAAAWQERMKKLLSEWQDLVTSSTILLTANIAFLAIQSVDQPPPLRSSAQIVSYVENREIRGERASVHVGHLFKGRAKTLAILYSLPYALLMWGMISFLAAFGLMCFAYARVDIGVVVGFFMTLGAVLVVLCLVLGWHQSYDGTYRMAHTLTYYGPEFDGSVTSHATSRNHTISHATSGSHTTSHATSIRSQPISLENVVLPVATASRTQSNAAPSVEVPVSPPRPEGPEPRFVGLRISIGRALLTAYQYIHPVVERSRDRQTTFNFV
ncbi:hypothetical protein D9619_013177 [Psilocybe cf. subviscida]|uniref:WW domain-containing protein n=1 Tax=Psilocybe cf. subviscida TaxID=2480587 RepID=A0A8H5B6L9_9AGAR|nr:hypothetical protein D9619_013177 [Psilocybe cf. subviscida]